jgi:hypothetical protein
MNFGDTLKLAAKEHKERERKGFAGAALKQHEYTGHHCGAKTA